MTEDFLHFIWKYRLYHQNLQTLSGQELTVLDPGRHNFDAGPDFSNARIRIGDTLWAGNVEIHLKASDWHLHHHDEDDAYHNVILHVVFENDRQVIDRNGQPVETLELHNRISDKLFEKYQYYLHNRHWIPCQTDLGLVSPITLKAWIERLFVERMERKSAEHLKLLRANTNSFEETFYQVLAGNFGFKLNEQPFRLLSRMVPLQTALKHRHRLMQLEALYFGASGLLNDDFSEDYPNALQQEWQFLQNKYSLVSIEKYLWKFLRLRPSNFPTIRISQFAALMHHNENLFSNILDAKKPGDLHNMFDVQASAYWDDHYTFDKISHRRTKRLGLAAVNTIIVNTVVQFLFLYSRIKNDPAYQERAIELLMQIDPEQNHITRGWNKNGIRAENAFEAQAVIELKNNYCSLKKCLHCSIGMSLLKLNA